MNPRSPASPLVNAVVVFAGLAIVILAMRATSDVLSPLLLALVLAIAMAPLLGWFMKLGASASLALILTILVTVLFILGVVWLVGTSVQDFGDSIAAYESRIEELEQSLGSTLAKLGVDPDTLAPDPKASPEALLKQTVEFASGIVSGAANWGVILLTSIFFLVEATAIPRKVKSITDEGSPAVLRIVRLTRDLRQYVAIEAGVGFLTAVANVILLVAIGVDFALLWGILAFFLGFVPAVGIFIAIVPPALMALIQFGVPQMLVVIVGYIIINFVAVNLIKPRFVQKTVNISVLVTFLSLILWGWVLGPIGAILGVPMAIVIQAILDSTKETRWLAYLMGSGSEPFGREPEPNVGVEEQALT